MESKAAVLPTMPVMAIPERLDPAKKAHEQIDRIVYLASLTSKFDEVDPMMDDLRSITASWDGQSALESSQARRLNELEARLKQYLITSDPVRTFTTESLSQQLADHGGKGKTNTALRSAVIILLTSLVAAGSGYLPFIPLSLHNRQYFAIPMLFVAMSIGISWLYLTALKNFKDEVRKAFKIFSIGVIAFGPAFSQYAIIQAFDLTRYPLFQFAGITWLLVLPYFFMYLGIRLYAKQLGVQSWTMKLLIAVAAWAVVVALAAFIPAVAHQDEYVAIFQNTGTYSMPFFALLALILARKIRKVVTPTYARPMMWMYMFFIINFVATTLANIPIPVSPDAGGGFSLYGEMLIFGIPIELLLMMTGYSFKKELSK